MDIKKITEFIADARWTAMLGELPVGTHTIPFPNVEAIKSCKAVAYTLNTDNKGRRYSFVVDKPSLSAIISVEETPQIIDG